jgi:hypothetical protein
VYLKEELSEQQIDDFVPANFFQPSGEKGFAFQKGIYLYSRISPVQKRAAPAIGISDASERENIKARMKASPLVYKILEDAVLPAGLKLKS